MAPAVEHIIQNEYRVTHIQVSLDLRQMAPDDELLFDGNYIRAYLEVRSTAPVYPEAALARNRSSSAGWMEGRCMSSTNAKLNCRVHREMNEVASSHCFNAWQTRIPVKQKKKKKKEKTAKHLEKTKPVLFIFSTNPTQTHLKTLKFLERLDGLAGAGEHTENVEANLAIGTLALVCRSDRVSGGAYRLAQRPALPHGNRIAFHDTECGRNMRRDVFMALFITAVFGNVVQVVPADDQRAVHLGGDDGASQDTSTDRDEASEGTLLVCRANVGLAQEFKFPFSLRLFHPPSCGITPRPRLIPIQAHFTPQSPQPLRPKPAELRGTNQCRSPQWPPWAS